MPTNVYHVLQRPSLCGPIQHLVYHVPGIYTYLRPIYHNSILRFISRLTVTAAAGTSE